MDHQGIWIVDVNGSLLVRKVLVGQPQVPMAKRIIALHGRMDLEEIAYAKNAPSEFIGIKASCFVMLGKGLDIIGIAPFVRGYHLSVSVHNITHSSRGWINHKRLHEISVELF